MVPALNDEALYAGWCRIGQPNSYRGPEDQERNDLAEGEGGRHYRRGVLAQQDRLRKERQRLRRAHHALRLHTELQDSDDPPLPSVPEDHAELQHSHEPPPPSVPEEQCAEQRPGSCGQSSISVSCRSVRPSWMRCANC